MQWHSDVNDPYVNCSEGVESMEWQEGGGPLDNVSVQNDNYGNKDFFLQLIWWSWEAYESEQL